MKDKFYSFLAMKLPKRLVYWCCIVVGAYATTGKYGDGNIDKIRYLTVIERYSKDNKLGFSK